MAGLPFAAALAARARDHLDRLAVAALVAILLLLAGVGVFPSGHPLHLPVAVGFYLLWTFILWLAVSASVLADESCFGLATIGRRSL